MGKFWRLERSNHHFPEFLKKKKNFCGLLKRLLSPTLSSALIFSLALVLGLAYLWQTNLNATLGYQINDLQQQLDQLQLDNKKLNLSYIESQSMVNIVSRSADYNLVPITNLETVVPPTSALALK